MRMRPIHDGVAFLARAGVGVVFVVHGWKKIQAGIDATSKEFHAMHVPLPTASAVFSTFVELLGGVALVIGLGLPVAGILLFLDMAGALVFVNGSNGLLITGRATDGAHQGFELVLVLGLASLLFAAGGGGRLTLDHRLMARRRARPASGEDTLSLDPDSDPPPWRAPDLAAPSGPAAAIPAASVPAPSGRASSASGTAVPGTPAPPAEPSAADPAAPRLAADIVGEPTQDVLVAGRRRGRRTPRDKAPDASEDDGL